MKLYTWAVFVEGAYVGEVKAPTHEDAETKARSEFKIAAKSKVRLAAIVD